MAEREVPTVDLSQLKVEVLDSIVDDDRLPLHLREEAEMRSILSGESWEPVEGYNHTEEWSVPVSPRTLAKVEGIIKGKTN